MWIWRRSCWEMGGARVCTRFVNVGMARFCNSSPVYCQQYARRLSSTGKHTESTQGSEVYIPSHLLCPSLCFLILLQVLVSSFSPFPCSIGGGSCGRQQSTNTEASPPPASRLLLGCLCWLDGLLFGGGEALVERTRTLPRLPRGLGSLLAGTAGATGRGCCNACLLARGVGRRGELGGVGTAGRTGCFGRLELLQGLELLELLEGVDVLLGCLAWSFGRLGALGRGCCWSLRLDFELGQLLLDRLGRHDGCRQGWVW